MKEESYNDVVQFLLMVHDDYDDSRTLSKIVTGFGSEEEKKKELLEFIECINEKIQRVESKKKFWDWVKREHEERRTNFSERLLMFKGAEDEEILDIMESEIESLRSVRFINSRDQYNLQFLAKKFKGEVD